MKSIYIKTEKLQDVFNELKDNFKGTLTAYDKEYTIDIKSDIARGNIEGIVFDKEMAYIQFNAVFHDDVRISVELANDLPIFFTYCFDGVIQHSFGEQGYKKSLKKNQSGILRSTSNTNSILYFKKNIPINFSIFRVGLNKVGDSNNKKLIEKIKKVFFKAKEDYLEVRPQNFKIQEKIQELKAVNQKGIVRNLLKNRILQIILEMEIEQHIDGLSHIANEINSLASRQISEIKKASNFVLNYPVEELFTLKYLTHKSESFMNKLHGGIKFINNRSMNNFLIYIGIERQRI